ncbi:hypothetical protein ASPBRDRAFT_195768 [Aspergillus brasiliensis CBS 101740]|uniref:Uncharacterized protein n=1 Tax=Aspergillus brasiliensis (strain CBS 101740 / IMI 381727 / IBT 21946) TaxID=767769 RepID=A0A1L9UIU9_ASPBC|nr:hypothetical protein ASPBRDRAFT_195768 [Aspergillus brasiliensis CBS 101740]
MSVFGGSSRKDNLSQHYRTSSASFPLKNPPQRVDTPSSDIPSPLDAPPIIGTPHVERRVTSRLESTLFSHNSPLIYHNIFAKIMTKVIGFVVRSHQESHSINCLRGPSP